MAAANHAIIGMKPGGRLLHVNKHCGFSVLSSTMPLPQDHGSNYHEFNCPQQATASLFSSNTNMDHLERSFFSGLGLMFMGHVMTEAVHSLPGPEMFYLFLFFAGFLAALFGCF
jgi:hypothetical protein